MTPYSDILKKYWGYDSFRGVQYDIIESVCQGRDTLGLMPTGGGKSITFQVPAMAMEGMCLVITPLIALMKDQVRNLRQHGIKALALYSGMRPAQMFTVLDNAKYGNFKFLYVSPERLGTELFQTHLKMMNICLITVDESHCISQWGYDFRPAYLKIADIRKLLPDVPILALTATATPKVVKDIQEKLYFKKENVFKMSFERKNLTYSVFRTEDKTNELLRILNRTPGSAIIYVRNRRKSREIAKFLQKQGIKADFYHAGLDDTTRDARQQRWQRDESRVIVATNAFGMGIDKPDVRLVIHLDLPDSIEAYFQEAGRAGRDGNSADAIILYSNSDSTTLKKHVSDAFPTKEQILEIYEHLQYYYQMAMGDGLGCIREFNIEDFCRKFKHYPIMTDSALRILSLAGYLEYTEEQDSSSRLLFTLRRDELYRLKNLDEETETLIQCVLRTYTGLFTDYAFISEEAISTLTGISRQRIYEIFIHLRQARIINYVPKKRTPYIYYTRERVDTRELVIPKAVYEDRRARYTERIEAMIAYVNNQQTCRSRMLLNYFGEKETYDCGHCDVCGLSKNHLPSQGLIRDAKILKSTTLDLILKQSMTPSELYHKLDADRDMLADVIRELIEDEKISLSNGLLCRK